MNNFEKNSNIKINKIFFSVKTAALIFSALPLFISIFLGQNKVRFLPETLSVSIMVLLLVGSYIYMRFLILKPNHLKILDLFEIVFFYILCILSIMFSGGNTSYYKFIFIFIILVYTIQIGMYAGILLSAISAAFMLITDWYGNLNNELNVYFYTDLCISAMFFIVAFVIGFYVRAEHDNIQNLKKIVNIDPLTGAFNHRYFHESLEKLCKESIEKNQPLSVFLVDIDFFEMYNNAYGYENGDKIIHVLASILLERAGKDDVVSRFGGDKFGIIMPGIVKEEAVEKAETLRKSVEAFSFEGEDAFPNKTLTISIGISEMSCSNDRPLQIIERAEDALYRAKFLRKNRVEIYSSIFNKIDDIDLKSKDRITLVKTLIAIVNSRDCYTYEHTERVVLYCKMFADFIKLNQFDRTKLIYGALLHDIGKINASLNTLISEHKLTNEEWEEMKMHPVDGAEIIKQLGDLNDVAEIVLEHHEKYDGSGYPYGLKGEEINKFSRMLTLADCFDAMTAKRPYQKQRSMEDAFEELKRCKGTHFDPVFTDQFICAVKNAKSAHIA